MESAEKDQSASSLFEWVESIVFALVCTILVLVFVVNFSIVSGSSMFPTLENGDRVIVRVIGYTPQKGDIITTDSLIDYGKPLAKRIIALGGDVVNINTQTGEVYVNDVLLDEPYISDITTQYSDMEYPLVVPQGKVFVMGDNRPHSADSRLAEIGLIDERDILGEIIFRISPNMGKVE